MQTKRALWGFLVGYDGPATAQPSFGVPFELEDLPGIR
jgi:hypothetical protein